MELLNHKILGTGPPLVIIHGLFGMLDNWQSFAKSIMDEYQVIMVDLRDHGKSPKTDDFSFDLAAEDIYRLLTHLGIEECTILGHSLGGKVAMRLTQIHPYLVTKLIVLDIGVKKYNGGHETIISSILAIDIDTVKSRSEIDEQLKINIPEDGVRLFLMKNLKRKKEGGFEWKANFPLLAKRYKQICSAIPQEMCLTPALFIKGSKSDYILVEDEEEITEVFTNAEFVQITDAGHWAHADQPIALKDEILSFLS